MKKKWFALLCSLLMLLPLASPVRATSYPASDIPNQVTEAGQPGHHRLLYQGWGN